MKECGCEIIFKEGYATLPFGKIVFCPLHAAAPDLIEALKMFLDLYGGHAADDAREERYEIIAARRALKKAKGE